MFLYLMLRWRLAQTKVRTVNVSMNFDIISNQYKLSDDHTFKFIYWVDYSINIQISYIQINPMLLKLATGFGLGIEVFIFAMIPYYYSNTFSNKKIINAFNNFSAGLFLGISFLHIIPESNTAISHWKLLSKNLSQHSPSTMIHNDGGHHHEIPFGSLIAIVTFLLVLSLEVYMNDGLAVENASQKRNNNHMHEILTSQKLKMRRRLMLQTYLTQLALSIHSLFQCMSIGVQNKEKVLITLAGAIIFHKWAQALTLGFSYSTSGMPRQTALKFALFHSFLNFGAVLIGYQLSQTSDLIKGITNGISGGTFIYITMVEKIGKNFQSKEQLHMKIGLIFFGLLFSIMILH